MSSRLPHATIFADASWCTITKAAGWGAWMIGRSKPSASGGGEIRDRVYGSTQAELLAMANALHVAAKRGYLAEGAEIMLQSDSVQMLGMLRHQFGAADRPMPDLEHGIPTPAMDPKCWRGKKKTPKEDDVSVSRRTGLLAIQRIVEQYKLKLIVRHVRGHRSKAANEGDGRAYVNEVCDKLAYHGMQKARLRLTSKGGVDAAE